MPTVHAPPPPRPQPLPEGTCSPATRPARTPPDPPVAPPVMLPLRSLGPTRCIFGCWRTSSTLVAFQPASALNKASQIRTGKSASPSSLKDAHRHLVRQSPDSGAAACISTTRPTSSVTTFCCSPGARAWSVTRVHARRPYVACKACVCRATLVLPSANSGGTRQPDVRRASRTAGFTCPVIRRSSITLLVLGGGRSRQIRRWG